MDASFELKKTTGIDLVSEPTSVSFLQDKNVDEVGFNVILEKKNHQQFLNEVERLAGQSCAKSVVTNDGCHYIYQSKRDVFISKVGIFKYQIRVG